MKPERSRKLCMYGPPTYTHNYPEFFTPFSRDAMIRVVAYSGDSCSNISTRTVSLLATPEIVFDPLTGVCANDPVLTLSEASVVNGLPGNGAYSGAGVNSGNFTPAAAGIGLHTIRYSFTGTNGCTNFKEQSIAVYQVPTVSAGADLFVLEGGNAILKGTATGNGLSYSWSPGTYLNNVSLAQPQTTPVEDISYTLTVLSADGCSASDNVVVTVLKAPTIPNVFSPNGDGVNDRWKIRHLESYPGATVEIFNRYGQLVFRSTGYITPWDGTSKGKALPTGTYYYLINPKNGRQQMSGFVDIVR